MKTIEDLSSWQDAINEVVCCDCMDLMKMIPDKAIDLILTDPPYNAKNIGPNQRKYKGQTMQLPVGEYKKFCENWFNEAQRISKTIVFTPGIANTHNYPQPDWILCWHKPASVSFNRMGGFNAWEPIFIYGKTAKDKRLGQDYLLFNTLNFKKGVESKHPCPKPPLLWEKILDTFSCKDDLILDPFSGSGTTGMLCKKHLLQHIQVDIIEDYCRIAEMRLEQELLF